MHACSKTQIGALMFTTLLLRTGLIVLLISVATESLTAGGWTLQEGRGFYKLGFQLINAREFYEPSGNKTSITPLGDYTVSVYAEYGVTDWVTGTAYVPFYKRNTLDRVVGRQSGVTYFEGDQTSHFADVTLGARIGIIRQSPTVLALSVQLGLPLGNSTQPNGLLSGDGEFNQLVSVEIGHSLHPLPMFATVNAGFNNRTRGFSDEFSYGAQVGYTFEHLVTLIAHCHGVESLNNGSTDVTGGVSGLYANNQRFLGFGLECMYKLTEAYGISLSAATATRGRNVLSAIKYSIGFSLKI